MKLVMYLALLCSLTLLLPLSASAKDKNQHSVNISDSLQVGDAQLKPGDYQVYWQQSGSSVRVEFMKNGRIVATVPATLKTNDAQVTRDDVVIKTTSTNGKKLEEIDFGRQKEALVFGQG